MSERGRDRRERDLGRFLRSRPAWSRGTSVSLCTAVGIGTPMDVHLVGGHLWSDAGPILGVLALFAGASFWLFRRFGGNREHLTAADRDLLRAGPTACDCDPSCEPEEQRPAEQEPLEREPIRA